MTRKEAIIDLKVLMDFFIEQSNGAYPSGLEYAIKELQDIEQRWIPCSERLPNESGEYLITGVGISPCVYQSFYYKSENVWSYRNLTVTAWMPLPEPYVERREE